VTRLDRETDRVRSTIWVADAEGGTPRPFTAGPRRDTTPRWSPDGRWLAFLSERDEAKAQLYLIPASGGEARRLTSLPFGAGPPAWSPDGSRIAFGARTGTPPDPDPAKARPFRRLTTLKYRYDGEGFTYDRRRHLFVMDLAEGSTPRALTDGDWDDAQPAWSPDGAALAFVSARHPERDRGRDTDIWVVSAAGGEPRRVTDRPGIRAAPAWSPDGRTLAFLHQPRYPANATVWLAAATGGEVRPVDPAFDRHSGVGPSLSEAVPPAWLPDGSLLTAAQDRGAVGLVQAREGQPTRWLAPAPRVVHAHAVAPRAGRVALVASTPARPPEVALLDLTSARETAVTDLNAGWRASVRLAVPERLTVTTIPGLDVDAWVMPPAALEPGRRYPVLLNIHGGPFSQYGEGFFDEFQVYAGAGYGVVYANPRGSSGRDTAFARALIGDLGAPDCHDVLAALEAALARAPWADGTRLAIMGGSYGGFLTSWIVGHDQRFRAAISERAVNDWYSFLGTSDIGSYFAPEYLGAGALLHEDVDALLRQSPLTYAKDIRTPVLILHSEDDLRCPIGQAELLWTVLCQSGQDAEFVRVPDETHELSRSGRPGHRVERFRVILDFLARRLPAP
jgi:dipeptidyl aminopeptidase/acylaminoacyl peptidase